MMAAQITDASDSEITYTLKSKDVSLVRFAYVRRRYWDRGIPLCDFHVKILRVFDENRHLLPKYFSYLPLNGDTLLNWFAARRLPRGRKHSARILDALGAGPNASGPLGYISACGGLSLKDAYWADEDARPARWADVSLYSRPFDATIADIALGGGENDGIAAGRPPTAPVPTPEAATDGALAKCWERRAGGVFLLKTDEPGYGGVSQSANEYFASQAADAMGFEHVPYGLEIRAFNDGQGNERRGAVSVCPMFTTENVGYVSAYDFMRANELDTDSRQDDAPDAFAERAALFGDARYKDLMLFDALIYNTDRHLGNYGMLADNDTGEFLRMAPIFDCGRSFFFGAEASDIRDAARFAASRRSRGPDFNAAAALSAESRHIPRLRALKNFAFRRPSLPEANIDESVIRAMEDMIHTRAAQIISLYEKKEAGRLRPEDTQDRPADADPFESQLDGWPEP